MSSVINALQNIVATVVTILLLPTIVVLALVETAMGGSFETHMAKHLEQIFGFFGLNGEDIINTSVSDVRLLGDEYLNMMTKIALIHEDTQANIIDIMQANILKVRMKFNTYFDYGKNTYYNGLPESNVTTSEFPTAAVVSAINTQYGVNCELSLKLIDVPTKEQWVGHKLHDLYGYNASTGKMMYLTYEYTMDYVEYNYSTNKYDSHMYRANMTTDTVTTTTTVSVIPIDAVNETKRTVVGISISGTRSITGAYTSSSSTTTDVVVATGSTTPGTTVVTTYPPVYADKYQPQVVSVDAYGTTKYFIAAWNEVGQTVVNYWTYLVGSGDTNLDKTLTTSNLDMLPIVTIRNNSVNLNATPTSTAYLQSKEMLDAVGMNIDDMTTAVMENPDSANVQDAFVYFGLDVSDTSPTVAKYVFKVFDYVLSQSGSPAVNATYVDGTSEANQFKITVSEGVYNSAMGWSYQTRNTVTGSIGPVGTYSSQVSGEDLILKGQISENQYVEYRIVQLFVVSLITRGGMAAGVTKTLLSGPVVMPMSYNLVDQFSSMEQLELYSKGLRLSTYAANITHLEWYETEGFIITAQILIIVGSLIAAFFTGGQSLTWGSAALAMLEGFAMAYIFKEILLKLTDNVILKMLITAVIVGVMATYAPTMIGNAYFFTADMITTSVTQWTEAKMEELQSAMEDFSVKAETKFKEIEDAMKAIVDSLDTTFVSMVARVDPVESYIKGPSLSFYQAIQLQFNHVDACLRLPYEQAFSYDNYYRVGVVNMV